MFAPHRTEMEHAPLPTPCRGEHIPRVLLPHDGLRAPLEAAGFQVVVYADPAQLYEHLARALIDVVFVDVGPTMLDLLHELRARHRSVPFIVQGTSVPAETAAAALRAGAFDALEAASPTRLLTTARNACAQHRLTLQVSALEHRARDEAYPGVFGRSPQMHRLFERMSEVAPSDVSVLLRGEHGTEKEQLARAIHDDSARSAGAFVAVDCTALRDAQQAAELFGRAGDDTWAPVPPHPGRIEAADRGTLFLDGITSLTPPVQEALLQVLRSGRVTRLGGGSSTPVTFRLIATTHRDLDTMVERGEFSAELRALVGVVELEVPPLREREGDTALLLDRTLARAASPDGAAPGLDTRARQALSAYRWPGNVRELENVLLRAAAHCRDACLHLDDLPTPIRTYALGSPANDAPDPCRPSTSSPPPSRGATLADLERAAIERELARCNGNVTAVGKVLGIGRTTLYRRLKEYGLR